MAADGHGAGPVILLTGPTGSGKSALAMAIAAMLPVEIVSVDAAQAWRGMDIGTAKPGVAERRAVPHHLLDMRSPRQGYSAAEFRADARRCVERIHDRGRIALLCGGTTFYFCAFEQGLSPLPAADRAVRERIAMQAAACGWPALHARLAAVDPAAAGRIDPNDRQRLQRALEILALTGRAPSSLMTRREDAWRGPLIKLILADSSRARLHRRIEERFRTMLAQGLVEETRTLFDPLRDRQLPAARTVGYRQVMDYLGGRVSEAEMIERALAATRQLAKRQLTWLRHQRGWTWLDAGSAGMVEATMTYLRARLQATGWAWQFCGRGVPHGQGATPDPQPTPGLGYNARF